MARQTKPRLFRRHKWYVPMDASYGAEFCRFCPWTRRPGGVWGTGKAWTLYVKLTDGTNACTYTPECYPRNRPADSDAR